MKLNQNYQPLVKTLESLECDRKCTIKFECIFEDQKSKKIRQHWKGEALYQKKEGNIEIYQCELNRETYNGLTINFKEQNMIIYHIKIQGKYQQYRLESFFFNQTYEHNDKGTFNLQIQSTQKDPAGRKLIKPNLQKEKEEQDLQEAINLSKQEYQIQLMEEERLEQQKIDLKMKPQIKLKNYMDEDSQSIEYLQCQEEQKQINNLGYTDIQSYQTEKKQQQIKQQKVQTSHKRSYDNNNPIKVYFMTKFKVNEIDHNFLNMHTQLEISCGRKRLLKDIIYK